MKPFIFNILEGIFFVILFIINIPIFIVVSICKLISISFNNIMINYLSKKKYNEKKIKKKLYKKIISLLDLEREINLIKDFWIPVEEYDSYTTLKYLFTNNKDTFVYKKNSDRYLFNYYDFNGYKEDFIEKWVNEIKLMFESNNKIQVKDVVLHEDDKEKCILKISRI